MKKLCLLTLAVLFATLATRTAFAADGKSVSYKSGDETVQGILYTPAGKGPFPGDHRDPRMVGTERLGEGTGLEVVRPGLRDSGHRSLSRQSRDHAGEAHEIMRGVPEDRAKRDLQRRL